MSGQGGRGHPPILMAAGSATPCKAELESSAYATPRPLSYILIGTSPGCRITSKHVILQYIILLLNQDNTTIKNNIIITCSTMNKFCREPEHRISITDSSISSFSFLAKIFYQFGATKSKPGRPSLQMSVIQHDPQWSSRKSESFKRTVEHPFLAGKVPRRAQGSPSQMPWKEQGPATSKAGTLLSSQPVQPRRRCPSQSIQASICRGDRSNTVSISGFSSRESNSLHKRN